MKNIFLAFGIILSMLFSMAIIPVHAASSGTCGAHLTWTLDNGTLTISGTGDMRDYYPSNPPWYSSCSSIKTVVIENGVTSIGDSAFSGCTGLTSITIPDSVTSIGNYAFYNTAWYNNQPDGLVYVGKVAYKYKGTMPSNTSISLKDDTKGIADYAFCDCTGLTSITIPDSVTSIGNYAFYWCSSLTSITIPDSVTSIGNYAFSETYSLTSITIPKNVTNIGSEAFWWSNVRTLNVAEENTAYLSYDNCLYNKEKKILVFCPYDKENCVILDGTTKIAYNAFFDCYGLKTLSIPNSVTSIGRFFGSYSLTDIYFQGSEGEWSMALRKGESDYYSIYYDEYSSYGQQRPCVHFDYRGETLTLNEGDVFKISETTTVNNLHINAADGFVKTSCKTITGEKINFDGNGKMYLDSGYTAKIERDHSETATTQGFMAGLTNPKDTVTMVLEVTGTANDVDYTGRTITQRFDFSGYEIAGLVNFGFTVCNIPKPLNLTLRSIE